MLWLITLLLQLQVITCETEYDTTQEINYVATYAPEHLAEYDAEGGPGGADIETF